MGNSRSIYLLTVIAALLAGCESNWSTIAQPGSGFVVELPGVASCASSRDSTSKGQLVGHSCVAELSRAFGNRTPPARFVVSWADLPLGIDPSEIEDLYRELAITGLPAGLQPTAAPQMLGGAQGMEYESAASASDGSQERLVVRKRFVVRQGRLFWVEAHGAMSNAAMDTWERITHSFQFSASE